jgi:hypothetical protein
MMPWVLTPNIDMRHMACVYRGKFNDNNHLYCLLRAKRQMWYNLGVVHCMFLRGQKPQHVWVL